MPRKELPVRRFVGALTGYGGSVIVTALVTLISIPIVVSRAGASDWAALAVGQAVGSGAAIVIGFGWGVTGPTEVARVAEAEARRIYRESFTARLALFGPVVVIACIIVWRVSAVATGAAIVNSIAYGATGLLGSWYFTGAGKPGAFFRNDTLPRVMGSALGIAAVAFYLPLVWFPTLQLVGVVVAVCMTRMRARQGADELQSERRRLFIVLREQGHGMVLSVVAAAVSSVPIVLVSAVAPEGLPAYALADKLLRFAITGFAPVLQVLQSWVPSAREDNDLRGRIRTAAVAGAAIAALGGIAFFVLEPIVGAVLSRSAIQVTWLLRAAFSVILSIMVLGQVVGLVALLALGQKRLLTRTSVIGGAVGLIATTIGAALAGATGAAFGVALGEAVALAPQVAFLARPPDAATRAIDPELSGANLSDDRPLK